jgi:hypothetical protein
LKKEEFINISSIIDIIWHRVKLQRCDIFLILVCYSVNILKSSYIIIFNVVMRKPDIQKRGVGSHLLKLHFLSEIKRFVFLHFILYYKRSLCTADFICYPKISRFYKRKKVSISNISNFSRDTPLFQIIPQLLFMYFPKKSGKLKHLICKNLGIELHQNL